MQESPDLRYMAARLMPTWGDSLEEQQQQRMPTDEPSFNQWARSLRVNPTGAVDNLMTAMQNLSVTNLVAKHETPDIAAKGDADQPMEV